MGVLMVRVRMMVMMEQVDCCQGQKVMHTDWWKEKKLGEQKTGNQTESLVRAVPFLKIRFLGGTGNKRFQSLDCFVLLVIRDRGKNCFLLIKNFIAERNCIDSKTATKIIALAKFAFFKCMITIIRIDNFTEDADR